MIALYITNFFQLVLNLLLYAIAVGYAAQNMLYRLAKTLNFDRQQAQIRNRAHRAANGLTGEKQNVRRLKTGLADERNLSAMER